MYTFLHFYHFLLYSITFAASRSLQYFQLFASVRVRITFIYPYSRIVAERNYTFFTFYGKSWHPFYPSTVCLFKGLSASSRRASSSSTLPLPSWHEKHRHQPHRRPLQLRQPSTLETLPRKAFQVLPETTEAAERLTGTMSLSLAILRRQLTGRRIPVGTHLSGANASYDGPSCDLRDIFCEQEALNTTSGCPIARLFALKECWHWSLSRESNTYTYVPDTSNPLAVQDFGSNGHPELMVPWGEGEGNATDPTDHSNWFIWPDSTFDKHDGLNCKPMYTNNVTRSPCHAI